MDKEFLLKQFSAIEEKIAYLVNRCHQLEAANTELKEENKLILEELETKSAAEKQNEEIKALVVSKIDDLMGRLNEFAEE